MLIKAFSCGAVVWRRNNDNIEVCLIKQFSHKDSWGIPKGHIQPDEDFETCAKREVREETGLHVALGELLPQVETTYKNENKVVVSYLAEPVSGELDTSDPECEVADAKWFSIDALPRVHVYQRPLIDHVINLLKQRHSSG